MVTGIETAGLVLATLPLAVSIVEHYRSGLKPFKDLRHFHREFRSHAVHVGTQHAIFRLHLDKLLRQIVPAAEAERLMKDPGGMAWRDEQLEQKFRRRVGESYDLIIDNVAEIQRVIKQLQEGLGPLPSIPPAGNSKATGAEKQAPPPLPWWVRVHFCFSRAKWGDLVQLLERHNDNIALLLEGNEGRFGAAACAEGDENGELIAAVRTVRKAVGSIHETVAQSWRCRCPVRHNACLLLPDRCMGHAGKDSANVIWVTPDTRFQLLFSYGSAPASPQVMPWDMYDMNVELLKSSAHQLSAVSPTVAGGQSLSSSSPVSADASTQDCSQTKQNGAVISTGSTVPPVTRKSNHHSSSGEEPKSLCAALSAANGSLPLNGVTLKNSGFGDVRLSLVDQLQCQSYAPSVLKLEDALGSASPPPPGHIILSRHQRFRAALALASSYLFLHHSPWLPEGWGKQNVLLRSKKSEPSLLFYVDSNATSISLASASAGGEIGGAPAVNGASSGTTTTTLLQHHDANRLSLRSLGVVLLELCFGHAFEAHPFHKDLLQCNLPHDVLVDMAARHWQRSVYGEAGPDYGRAVHACVSGDLELRHLHSDDFHLAVYAEVVLPLERAVRQFEGLVDSNPKRVVSVANGTNVGGSDASASGDVKSPKLDVNTGPHGQPAKELVSAAQDADDLDRLSRMPRRVERRRCARSESCAPPLRTPSTAAAGTSGVLNLVGPTPASGSKFAELSLSQYVAEIPRTGDDCHRGSQRRSALGRAVLPPLTVPRGISARADADAYRERVGHHALVGAQDAPALEEFAGPNMPGRPPSLADAAVRQAEVAGGAGEDSRREATQATSGPMQDRSVGAQRAPNDQPAASARAQSARKERPSLPARIVGKVRSIKLRLAGGASSSLRKSTLSPSDTGPFYRPRPASAATWTPYSTSSTSLRYAPPVNPLPPADITSPMSIAAPSSLKVYLQSPSPLIRPQKLLGPPDASSKARGGSLLGRLSLKGATTPLAASEDTKTSEPVPGRLSAVGHRLQTPATAKEPQTAVKHFLGLGRGRLSRGYFPHNNGRLPSAASKKIPASYAAEADGAGAVLRRGPVFATTERRATRGTECRLKPISDRAQQCLVSFDVLLQAFAAAAPRSGEEEASESLLRDELGRFRIWTASTSILENYCDGLNCGRRSGSYAELEQQTLNILSELATLLDEGVSILRSTQPEEVGDQERRVADLLEDMKLDPPHRDDVRMIVTAEPPVELRQNLAAIAKLVSSLLKLSALFMARPGDNADNAPWRTSCPLRNSLAQYALSEDQALVLRMFPRLRTRSGAVLVGRLVGAMALRRQQLRVPLPIGQGARAAPKATDDELPIFDVRLPDLTAHGELFLCPFCARFITTTSDASWRKHVMSDIRPYVCTGSDGGPGVGVGDTCYASTTLFATRRAWFDHDLAAHRRQWHCRVCAASAAIHAPSMSPPGPIRAQAPASTFTEAAAPPSASLSAAEFDRHLRAAHLPASAPPALQQRMLRELRAVCETPVEQFRPDDCPLCLGTAWSAAELDDARSEWEAGLAADSTRMTETRRAKAPTGCGAMGAANDTLVWVSPARFSKHVGRHMEQLALGALRRWYADVIAVDDEAGADDGASLP